MIKTIKNINKNNKKLTSLFIESYSVVVSAPSMTFKKFDALRSASHNTIQIKDLETFLKIKDIDAVLSLNSVDIDDYNLSVKNKNKTYKLAITPNSSYPVHCLDAAKTNSMSINAIELYNILSKAIKCASTDKTRPHLNSVLFEVTENKLTLVSTDASRLFYDNLTINCWNKAAFSNIDSFSRIVSSEHIEILLTMLKGAISANNDIIYIDVDNHYIKFIIDEYELTCRLLEGTFPNWRKVIPENYQASFEIDRSALIDACKEIVPFNDKTYDGIYLKATEHHSLIISNYNETISIELPFMTHENISDLNIAFRDKAFIESLGLNGSDVTKLTISNGVKPIVKIDDNLIIMQARTSRE